MLKLWNVFSDNCRIWQYFLNFPQGEYKDIYRKIINNQHHACILEANYYLSVYNVSFNLALSTE